MTDADALQRIQALWVLWAKRELSDAEFGAKVAEALEQSGYPVIANDNRGGE